jgi:cell cycle arrest protein BUB3
MTEVPGLSYLPLQNVTVKRLRTLITYGPSTHLPSTPIYNTFASAGSDGTVSIWDHKVKKRLRQYQKYKAAIPSIAFNCDGSRLAVGVSYTWDDGEEGLKNAERPAVFVRKVGDEVKVRFLSVLEVSF